ncbi:MAG: DUF5666 domain-containing protein, partial [Acidobacteriota bacterium]
LTLTLAATHIAMLLAACGGQGSSPTAPSSGTPGAASSATTVAISGTVRSGSSQLSVETGASVAGITVTVVGTAIKADVDGGGRFTLSNVPPGDVQLKFSGAGVDSTVTLTALQAAQTVTIIVNVSGGTAAVEAEQRVGGATQELEGRVESLPPTTAAGSLTVAGRSVLTTASTTFTQGSAARTFADLQLGMRVHVKGTVSGTNFVSSQIVIQNTNTWVPVTVNGVIDSLVTGPVFQFKVGSRLVKGDDLTEWFGTGNTAGSIALLSNGARVEVKGQQRDGYIYAERIHVNAPGSGTDGGDTSGDSGDGQDTSASIHGKLTAVSGAAPTLTLTVAGTTVTTTAATTVKRRGDVQTLAQLKLGQTLHVIGARQPGGALAARQIDIDDDATGGEFEIEGSAGGVKGTCPSLAFGVNGFDVVTDAATIFEGGTCASLHSGDKVKVNGTKQAGGVVLATRVRTQ